MPDDIAEPIPLDPDLVRQGAEGAAARPPRRRAAAGHDRRPRRARSGTSCRRADADVARQLVHRVRGLRVARALPGDLRPHRRGDADAPTQLTRVARECVEDLAADGVVYAEVRYAPEQHLAGGLTLDEVVAAVQEGFDEGQAAAGGRIVVRQLLTAMRHQARSREIAELASPGATAASSGSTSPARRPATRPPGTSTRSSTSSARTRTSRSTPARRSGCRRSGRRSSGAAPTGSVTACGSSTTSRSPTTGRSSSAGWRRTCATSGSRWRCARPPTCRPAPPRRSPSTRSGCCTRLRFRVTVNTDNRLMSGTSMTREMTALGEAFGYGLDDLRWFTINAMKSRVPPVRRAAGDDRRA